MTPFTLLEFAMASLHTEDEGVLVFPCDYCDEGNVAVEGWHIYPDPDGVEGTAHIPCRTNPPTHSMWESGK